MRLAQGLLYGREGVDALVLLGAEQAHQAVRLGERQRFDAPGGAAPVPAAGYLCTS